MRMDRYEDENKLNDIKSTRTNKNQELYTDVYLNNVYVDLNNLKEVMEENDDKEIENIKLVRDVKPVSYSYEDKNYDINEIIEEVIKNKKDDNIKRSLDIGTNDLEIANLIESIEESSKNKEDDEEKELLSDLLPSSDNTSVIPPLEEPLNALEVENRIQEEKKENEELLEEFNKNDLEVDNSFLDEDKSKKSIIIPIIIILILIGVIVGILFYKDII